MMRVTPTISAKAIGEAIGVTTRGVEKNIGALKQAGVIERVGAAKGGHWIVHEDNEGYEGNERGNE
jgi:ATP-dependent DNA helicase RecG